MNLEIEEGLYKFIFDNTLDGFAYCEMIFDARRRPVDFVFLKVNQNFEKFTGLKNVEGKKVTKVIPGINISNPELFRIYGKVSLTGKSSRFETYVEELNRWFFISAYSPKKGFFVAVFQNITERKLLESYLEDVSRATANVLEDLSIERDKLSLSKAKDEAILSSIGEGLIAFGNDRKVMIINRVAEIMLGWNFEDIEDKKFDILPFVNEAGDFLSLKKQLSDIAAATITTTDKKTVKFFYCLVHKDETRVPAVINVTPIQINNKIIGVVIVIRDITLEREAERAKSEFLSIASHQLRTPLGICKWYAEAIIEDKAFQKFPATVQNYLKEIYKNNGRLISLVSDLLSVSRIDQGKVENNPQLVNVINLVKSTIEGMNILAKKKGNVLSLKVTKSKIPDIYIDPMKVQEVIENLLSNAINYNKPLGSISVSIDYKDHQVLIAVKDTGIGISAKDQKEIFTKFYRSKIATSKNTEGTGLGLYVAKAYVTEWGGQIKVKSIPEKGSTFTITIPEKALSNQSNKESEDV